MSCASANTSTTATMMATTRALASNTLKLGIYGERSCNVDILIFSFAELVALKNHSLARRIRQKSTFDLSLFFVGFFPAATCDVARDFAVGLLLARHNNGVKQPPEQVALGARVRLG